MDSDPGGPKTYCWRASLINVTDQEMKIKKLKPAADKVKNCKNWHISRINCRKRRRRQLRNGILVWDVGRNYR
jgi:hypothetical protein